MDFPLFHLDFLNNRMLIATIAVLHVVINHGLAVGLIPIVTLLEYRGYKASALGYSNSENWDKLAYKIMFVGFVITTSVGAMTGVGIWFSTSLVNPAAIGSLTRVFYGAWFTEWIVFVLEVVFIMLYFLSWKHSKKSLKIKRKHIGFGVLLSIFSMLTMFIIVAILGFMMDSGNWLTKKTFWTGVSNPMYLPQLLFRIPFAMMLAAAFAIVITSFMLKSNSTIKPKAMRMFSIWALIWAPVLFIGSYIYYYQIPDFMIGNLPVAVTTLEFQEWYSALLKVIFISILIALLLNILFIAIPKTIHRSILIIPLISLIFLLGYFERIREFIRKPYIIDEYMYANGLKVEDYQVYKSDGILKHSVYSQYNQVTSLNKIEAGKDVFNIACTRCHTTYGINSVVNKFESLYGETKPLEPETMAAFIGNIHNVKFFMPPFPGNNDELNALSEYIAYLQQNKERLQGAQTIGVKIKENSY